MSAAILMVENKFAYSAKPQYKAEWVVASQELVDSLLNTNRRNRPLKQHHVKWFVDSIKGDRWLPNPDAIAVSENGVLLNGQHRLEGIKAAGYPPVPFLLVSGLPEKAMSVIDRGISRTMRDVLSLLLNDGISAKVVAALTWLSKARTNKINDSSFKPSPEELIDLIDRHQELIGELMPLARTQRSPVVAAVIEYASRSPANAKAFADQLLYGENLVKHDPAYKLREELKEMKGGGSIIQMRSYMLTVAAIIKHSLGKKANCKPSETADWALFPSKSIKK